MEIWKDITGFEGYYQVSNKGNVRSVERTQKNGKGVMVHYKSRLLKQHPNSNGYLRVVLKKQNVEEKWFVHRLVALHFVDNSHPQDYMIVNHIDSDFLNNDANNLEWTNYRGNIQHALQKGRMNRTEDWLKHLRESNEKNGKPIVGTNIRTGKQVHYACLNDCKAAGFQPSCVCNCCKGIRKTHKGHKWEYADKEGVV